MNKVTSKKSFHFWNSFNFLVVVLLLVMIVLRFGNHVNLVKSAEVSRLVYNWLAFACGFASLAYFFFLRKKCGKLAGDVIWLAGGLGMIGRGIFVHFSIRLFGVDALPADVYFVFHVLCLLVLISFLTVNTMISINCFLKPKKKVDYTIIHGATTGSRIVNNRTDAAAEYLRKEPEVMAIASGGKGSDEQVSEAEYISDRLEKQGIAGERIIREDRSTTTYENLAFSKELMKERAPFLVVTDDYHILRTRLLARKVFGTMPEGLPVHSSRVSLPHYVLREYFSLIVNSFRGHLL